MQLSMKKSILESKIGNSMLNKIDYLRKTILKKKILGYYQNYDLDTELELVLRNIKSNRLQVFNYSFAEYYKNRLNDIYFDKIHQMFFVYHDDKKIYFKKSMSRDKVNEYYNSICMEQDKDSPHRYLDNSTYEFIYGGHVYDVGAAEGIFTLGLIDIVEKVCLFECDKGWIEALKVTFAPYKDKVQIIEKYVSDKTYGKEIRLDDFAVENNDKCVNLIKMDIEGAEIKAINGAKHLLKDNKKLRLLICAYHKQNDEKRINRFFDRQVFNISARTGYMLFLYDKNLKAPFFRRGVLIIEKKNFY